jgi:GLPGLI family protein
MKTILILNFFFIYFNTYSQKIDTCILKIKYNLTSQRDSTNKNNKRKDLVVLEIGRFSSLFYSEYKKKGDSILKADEEKGLGVSDLGANKSKYNTNMWSLVLMKDYEKNTISASEQLMEYYRFTEPIQTQNWTISNDTATFYNFLCQKATCNFRGRDFEAWFTNTVPINKGLWKFDGLPGLIVKVFDTKKQFNFELSEIITNGLNETIIYPEKKYIPISRLEFIKMKKARFEDPISFLESQNGIVRVLNSNGQQLTPEERKAKQQPYNPIELY